MTLHFCNKYNILVVRCVCLLLSYYPEAQWTHVDIIVSRLNSKFDLRRLCRSVGATILPKFVSLHNNFFLFPYHLAPSIFSHWSKSKTETGVKRAAEVEPSKLHQNENSLRASSPSEKSAAPIFGSFRTRYFQRRRRSSSSTVAVAVAVVVVIVISQ